MKVGDSITTFFHKVLKDRTAKNQIDILVTDYGGSMESPQFIADMVKEFYMIY